MTELQKALFAAQDPVYRAFNAKLLPTVAPETVIGVRTPRVREIARELGKSPAAAAFLARLPQAYFEENNVHAALINRLKDFDEAYARGEFDYLVCTNLVYRNPELLQRPWYIEADLSVYLAKIIDTMNHNVAVTKVITPTERLQALIARNAAK